MAVNRLWQYCSVQSEQYAHYCSDVSEHLLEHTSAKEGTVITGGLRDVEEFEGKTVRYVPLWEWLLA